MALVFAIMHLRSFFFFFFLNCYPMLNKLTGGYPMLNKLTGCYHMLNKLTGR